MIRTRVCDLLGIEHPIVLGGMGSIYAPALVAAVSEAGGLGTLGCHYLQPEQVRNATAAIRERTNRPFGLNFLIFDVEEDGYAAALALRPPAIALAWPRPEQDIRTYIARAHEAGSKVTFMAGGVPEAVRAAECGADVIIAQGTEGGGHVGWQATMALVPMVVDAVAPVPVLAAGGIADGRGLAAALSLGADGVLLGARFLASEESPLHPNFKQAIVDSDGHDTLLSEIPDIAAGKVWPGAMSRTRRNGFIERWAGREWALRQQRGEAFERVRAARQSGDADEAPLSMGQDAGLIHDVRLRARLSAASPAKPSTSWQSAFQACCNDGDARQCAPTHTTCPERNRPRGMLWSVSKPSLVTRTISPVCTPADLSRVMTFGCTTMHMFSLSTILGVLAAGRLFDPMIGWK
jgi:NAD(P)H-dependent flavin oxidoreductase YrpB (nitropropane dioxygenase family)